MDEAESSRKSALGHLNKAIRLSRQPDRCGVAISVLADGAVDVGAAKAHARETGMHGKTVDSLSSEMLRAATLEVIRNCSGRR